MEALYSKKDKRRWLELPLPSASDFFRERGGETALAWDHFGGLTLDPAYNKFITDPFVFCDDFTWMFPKAFEYYFPVLDRYLRTIVGQEDDGEDVGWWAGSLGNSVRSQFRWKDGTKPPDYVVAEITSLSSFVKSNLPRYAHLEEERIRIKECWLKVDQEVFEFYNPPTQTNPPLTEPPEI